MITRSALNSRPINPKADGLPGAALEAGLSAPVRLPHPRVRLAAASPGQIKSGGAGWIIKAGFGPSPFGECLAAQGPRGVCRLSFVLGGRKRAWDDLKRLWPRARWQRDDAAAQKLLAGMFARPGRSKARQPLTLSVKGTDFQLRVWRALLRVPFGRLTTYGQLAAAMGAPSAARAVGAAVGKNELAWLIPCHRVIRRTGAAGGYRWGAARKRAMLAWEASAGRGGALSQ
jgi:AraC family transcriptional regulator of adaptative response/methylated-DNA-[protein]-cysteine methyltransferase